MLYTLRKLAFKWPMWLQMAMTKAVVSGLPQGFPYGCAQGTIIAVEAGYIHMAADVSCTLVRPSRLYTLMSLKVLGPCSQTTR